MLYYCLDLLCSRSALHLENYSGPGCGRRCHLHFSPFKTGEPPRSLASQTFYGISDSSFDGLITNSEQGDENNSASRCRSDHKTEVNSVGKSLKPLSYSIPTHWNRNHKGHDHQSQKIAREEHHNLAHRGAHYFPDADFFGPLTGHVGN